MGAEFVVVFDLAPTASGAYYVAGETVWHDARVCVVQSTTRLDGTRFRAHLRVVPRPTPGQRRDALAWADRMRGPLR